MGRRRTTSIGSIGSARHGSRARRSDGASGRSRDELTALRSELEDRERELARVTGQLDATRASLSWRLTAPLRDGKALLRRLVGEPDDGGPARGRLPRELTSRSPWSSEHSTVPLLETPATVPRTGVRTVAFYLPQFHPIPENDIWWGRGFTEWTNVAAARPLYEGHYQPHLPGELGFYDLRVVDNQRRQVELARLYGIDAFCFYAYWFGGRRLLELPLRQYADTRDLALPFCICWANENWTRRWDGSESTVLIGQSHSPEDDIAFIDHYARYFHDPRYLRIDGRPLLIVYRAGQLPDARATTRRWRERVRESHGTELFLAHVHAVDDVDPDALGFDAGVEFPPLRPRDAPVPRERSATLEPLSPDVRSEVFDWRELDRSKPYAEPEGRLFRSVCPSWDNTPRRGNSSVVLWNSSPAAFQNWLLRAFVDTEARLPESEQLVFVNAWNEWAEGCHLEPDQRYGYAWLEAVRVASVRAGVRRAGGVAGPRLGVVAHAADPDAVHGVVRRLERLSPPPHVLLTTAAGATREAEARLGSTPLHVEILESSDEGAGTWSFVEALPRCAELGWDVVLKLPPAASDDGATGTSPPESLEGLLAGGATARLLSAFAGDTTLGMVGAAARRRSIRALVEPSARRVSRIAHRLGIEELRPDHAFFAGDAVAVRLDALAPLRAIQLDVLDAGPAVEHPDGGLADALEACLPLSVEAAGHTVRDTNELPSSGPARIRGAAS